MAKKRKAEGRPFGDRKAEVAATYSTKLNVNTFEDVADSEDEFHAHRDKISLEENPAQKKQRQIREEEQVLEPSDEEVLPESDQSSLSPEDDFEDSEKEQIRTGDAVKGPNLGEPLQDPDVEELVALGTDREIVGWGTSKKDYYDADAIETEADALEEEAEARRLQQKQLQNMTEADFGFDEIDWLEAGKDDEGDVDGDGVRREILPKFEISDAMGPEERSKIMRKQYPEFEPLAREFLDLHSIQRKTSDEAKEAAMVSELDQPTKTRKSEDLRRLLIPETIATLKHRALNAYLGSLSMYFALLTSRAQLPGEKASPMVPQELREHAVMETLVECCDLWERIKDIPSPVISSKLNQPSIFYNRPEENFKGGTLPQDIFLAGDTCESSQPISNEQISKHQRKRIRKAERLALASQAEANARREERLRQTEASIASLPDFTQSSTRIDVRMAKKTSQEINEEDSNSDFGEATSLTAHEAVEKAKRKMSLKFYTSQIAQKSNRRDGAGRDAGGDFDLPHRERLKDRQERLNVEAERRGRKGNPSAVGELLVSGSGDEDGELTNAQRRQNDDVGKSGDDYYDLVAQRTLEKKASKAAIAKAQTTAFDSSIAGNFKDAALEVDGKRAITYAIEKNKGLHPHRKKDVRNPRVKKRKKYEAKKKKLGSVRAVYKSDREGKGGYGGEKTGIKRGLVRSVRL